MKKGKRDHDKLDPLRRALYDAIKEKGVSEAFLSRAVRGNGYFVNKYLWENNPQELRIDEGIKLADALSIDPEKILGERYRLLTDQSRNRVINPQKTVNDGSKKMDVIYDIAVQALSKLSPQDMVKAISDATDLSAQRAKTANPHARETM